MGSVLPVSRGPCEIARCPLEVCVALRPPTTLAPHFCGAFVHIDDGPLPHTLPGRALVHEIVMPAPPSRALVSPARRLDFPMLGQRIPAPRLGITLALAEYPRQVRAGFLVALGRDSRTRLEYIVPRPSSLAPRLGYVPCLGRGSPHPVVLGFAPSLGRLSCTRLRFSCLGRGSPHRLLGITRALAEDPPSTAAWCGAIF